MNGNKMTHLTKSGKVRMVDIGNKEDSSRTAVATARVLISDRLLNLLKENSLEKGDALSVARIAGILAAKQTDRLIPLCHTIPLSSVTIDLELDEDPPAVIITAIAVTTYKTGVEMEALTAASIAALTIYDMGKSVDREMVIDQIKLESKDGGKTGRWQRESER